MSRPARGLVAALATAAALVPLTVVAAPADAAPATVPTRVTYAGHSTSPDLRVTVRGTVESRRAVCRTGRTVVLVRLEDSGGRPARVGTARTTARGTWRVRFDGEKFLPGTFRTSVRRAVVRHRGQRVVCGADTLTYGLG